MFSDPQEAARVVAQAREVHQEIISATPLGRIGPTEEIAALARFLLSEESSYTTGQTVIASGGRVMLPGERRHICEMMCGAISAIQSRPARRFSG